MTNSQNLIANHEIVIFSCHDIGIQAYLGEFFSGYAASDSHLQTNALGQNKLKDLHDNKKFIIHRSEKTWVGISLNQHWPSISLILMNGWQTLISEPMGSALIGPLFLPTTRTGQSYCNYLHLTNSQKLNYFPLCSMFTLLLFEALFTFMFHPYKNKTIF